MFCLLIINKIDFADCMCGDPLYDIARIYLELKGDLELFQFFLDGYYLTMNEKEKDVFKFYTVSLELWLDSGLLNKLMGWV